MKFQIGDDGVARYTTIDGDMIDQVVFAYYGTHEGTTEAVLDYNRDLAARPPTLPSGVTILLPEITIEDKPVEQIRLWD